MHHDTLIFSVALIGALGLGAQWLAWRLQAPAIVLMSLAGLAVGPLWAAVAGEPLLDPTNEFGTLLMPIIALAVAVILFEGGLALKFDDLRDAGRAVRRMVFFGGPLALILGSLVVHYIAGLDWASSIVFACVLIVTGPTVIMPLLRQSKLGGRTGAALKWEGIINDPIGALFAVAAFETVRVANAGDSIIAAAGWIIFAAAFGAILGIAFGWGMANAFRRGWTPEFLKAPIIFASVLLCYALADMIEAETGLVAVTAFGMTLANSRLAGLTEMRRFKENIAVLLISGVFVILTASLTPETIARALTWRTLFFLIAMMLVVRPISIWVSTFGTLKRNEALLLGWIAPRGVVAVAISSFFGSRLMELDEQKMATARTAFEQSDAEGLFQYTPVFPGAASIEPLAFSIVFVTVVLHGFTIGPFARALGLAHKVKPGTLLIGVNPWSVKFALALQNAGADVILADANWRRLKPAREAGLETFFGEVLSEDAEVRLDHARFETAIALSANEPYNALVSSHFAPELGRHRVFQLSSQDGEEEDPRGIGIGARGRTLIRRGRTYDALIRDFYRGWKFARTRLSDHYGLEEFRADRPHSDFVAEIKPDGAIIFLGPNREPRGGDGTILISFGPEETTEEGHRAAEASASVEDTPIA